MYHSVSSPLSRTTLLIFSLVSPIVIYHIIHGGRFLVTKPADDKSDDAPPMKTPNYLYGKPREGLHVLDMSKQPSRWEQSEVEEQVRIKVNPLRCQYNILYIGLLGATYIKALLALLIYLYCLCRLHTDID